MTAVALSGYPEAVLGRSTKVLANGTVADLDAPIPTGASVTVLAALPCDG